MDGRFIDKKIALGIMTIFRVTPWILMGDKRSLDVLVSIALYDVKSFIECDDYFTLLRATMQIWLGCIGVNVNPDIINVIVGEVTQQVTKTIEEQYDDGLGGTIA